MFAYLKLVLIVATTTTLGCTFDSSNIASEVEDSGTALDGRVSIDAGPVDADPGLPDASLSDSGFSTGQPDAAPDAAPPPPDAAPDAAPPPPDAAPDAALPPPDAATGV